MSYTYPEWVIPASVDKAELLQECERAMFEYLHRGFHMGLCFFTQSCGMGNLHHTLRVTLADRRSWLLEDCIEERNGFPRYLLDRGRESLAERRVDWLRQLKEKLS